MQEIKSQLEAEKKAKGLVEANQPDEALIVLLANDKN